MASHDLSCAYFHCQVILGSGLGGENGVSVSGLLKEGYEAVFLGFGLPDPKSIPIFEDLTEGNGFYTSKDFLPRVASASKPGMDVFLRCNLRNHSFHDRHVCVQEHPP